MSQVSEASDSGRPRRGYDRSANGLIGAIVAVLLLIFVMFLLTRLVQRDVADPAETIDYRPSLAEARADAPFEVLAPEPVPPRWRATSAEAGMQDGDYVWHLGFVVDDEEYAAVDQSTASAQRFIADVTPAAEQGQPVEVNGVRWQTFHEEDGDDNALVLRGGESTTVVSGTVAQDALIGFAESLQE